MDTEQVLRLALIARLFDTLANLKIDHSGDPSDELNEYHKKGYLLGCKQTISCLMDVLAQEITDLSNEIKGLDAPKG